MPTAWLPNASDAGDAESCATAASVGASECAASLGASVVAASRTGESFPASVRAAPPPHAATHDNLAMGTGYQDAMCAAIAALTCAACVIGPMWPSSGNTTSSDRGSTAASAASVRRSGSGVSAPPRSNVGAVIVP